jgi:uncharacterized protein (TIGR02270 family)
MTVEAAVLWDVVEEHLDEATFLLQSWRTAVRSPRSSLTLLQKTVEPRLLAHLDALAVGGPPVADALLWPALGEESEAKAPAVAAIGSALLLGGDAADRDRVVDALRTTELASVRAGLIQAFEITPRTDVDEPLKMALYATDAPATHAALLEVLAARRVDPGPIVTALLGRPDPEIARAALRATAASPDRTRHRNTVEALLSHDDPGVRGAALRTGLIWNLNAAWQACVRGARAGQSEAMLFLAMLGDRRELPVLFDSLRAPDQRKSALYALGFSGRVEAVDACLPHLADEDPRVAKLAVEAIASVTGLPLYDPPFVLPPSDDEDGELPPLEEDLAIDLTPRPIDELPRPNAAEIGKWWSDRRPQLAAGQRYLRGLLLSPASAEIAFSEGPLRRVGAIASEIAVRTGGRLQLPALRLARAKPALPADLVFQRDPGWI